LRTPPGPFGIFVAMSRPSRLWTGLIVGALLLGGGCAAMRDDLRRAEVAFDQAKYEDVLVWLDALERDLPHMEREQRIRFYYLRGTTAYRLEDKPTARHYLALCREEARRDGTALRLAWRRELERLLAELTAPEAEEGTASAGSRDGKHEKVPALSM
jgi:hypothetical protein